MDRDKVLSAFRRYRRACQPHGSVEWDEETLIQYDDDKGYLTDIYQMHRHLSFGTASDIAMEVVFMRCFEEETNK